MQSSKTILNGMSTTYSITSKFQITIPKEARDKLGISSHNRVKFKTVNNQLIVEKVPTMEEVADSIATDLKKRNVDAATNQDIKNARYAFYNKGLKWH
jgi:AbrB family looped-hinge helix DNA binding protein